MIRKLTSNDQQAVKQLIMPKPAENLFIIGDLEAYGFDTDIQELWGQFEEDQLIAVLLRYDSNFIPFSETNFDAKGFAEIMMNFGGPLELSGLQHVVEPIRNELHLPVKEAKCTYYAKCERLAYDVTPSKVVERLQSKDYLENIEMLQSIPEFKNSNFSIESRERAEEYRTGRTYIVRNEEGMMVTSASSTAENSQSAMIVAVGTKPGYEGQGFATICMEKLCSDLIAEGKTLCLFYHNLDAGRIYKRLGFQDIGFWTMIRYDS